MGEAKRKEAHRAEASADAQRFLEFLSTYVEDQFRRTGEVKPMFDGITAAGEHVIVPAPWRDEQDKVAILEVVRELFRAKQVVRYGMLSEVWLARYGGRDLKGGGSPDVMPRDRNDRQEAVVVAVIEPPVVLFGTREIIRPWDGSKAHLGPLELPHDADRFKGRMTELLS